MLLKHLKHVVALARQGQWDRVTRSAGAAFDYFTEPVRMRSLPAFLQVEPTILCNLECSFCINPSLPRERTSLTLEKFKRIVDEVPSVTKISLVGIGETFMNREIWSIIRYAKSRGIYVATTSNATILTDRLLGEVLDSGIDLLNFSIDGAVKETYERLRPGATFETVIANIRRIAAAVEGRRHPELAVWFLTSSENARELPEMVALVKSIGIRSLNTQGVHYWGHPDWHERANRANALDNLAELLRETRRRAEAAGVRFQWHNFPDLAAERECKWPWKGAYVTADGFVTPCCENGSDPQRINFGNIFDQPFVEIWNSDKYRSFRRELKSRDSRPAICVDCPSYHKPITVSTTTSHAG